MKLIALFLCTCCSLLVRANQQRWNLSCDAEIEYQNITLIVRKKCQQDSFHNILLHTGKGNDCDWNKIIRQLSVECNNIDEGFEIEFQQIYSGLFCLAIYNEKWINSFPICNTETPLNLTTALKEVDVGLWNPSLIVSQSGDKGLLIRLETNNSDGYNFKQFITEIYVVDENVTECSQLFHIPDLRLTLNFSSPQVLVNNLTENYYCVQVTPVDPRCEFPYTTTYGPCTRSTMAIQLLNNSKSDNFVNICIWVVGILTLVLIIMIVAFQQKRKKPQVNPSTEDAPLLPSIFLLHSNDDTLKEAILQFKRTLQERLPGCKIEDYSDEHQWESVSEEGASWFLSRLNRKENLIIIIVHALRRHEPKDSNKCENVNTYFLIGMEQLKSLASLPSYKSVLIVRFLNPPGYESMHCLNNVYQNFKLPEELEQLIERIQELQQQGHFRLTIGQNT